MAVGVQRIELSVSHLGISDALNLQVVFLLCRWNTNQWILLILNIYLTLTLVLVKQLNVLTLLVLHHVSQQYAVSFMWRGPVEDQRLLGRAFKSNRRRRTRSYADTHRQLETSSCSHSKSLMLPELTVSNWFSCNTSVIIWDALWKWSQHLIWFINGIWLNFWHAQYFRSTFVQFELRVVSLLFYKIKLNWPIFILHADWYPGFKTYSGLDHIWDTMSWWKMTNLLIHILVHLIFTVFGPCVLISDRLTKRKGSETWIECSSFTASTR